MAQPWRVTVWGVRGAFPRTGAAFARYGGNTSCFSLQRGGDVLIFDAGTGLSALGAALGPRPRRLTLLLSHYHLDHLLGLADFAPLSQPGCELDIWGPGDVQARLDALIGPPYWPVHVGAQGAAVRYHTLAAGQGGDLLPGLRVTALAGLHPGGSLLYRVDGDGRSLVYGLDCELAGDVPARLADFARGVDLLICDGGTAPGQLRPGWGHATWAQAHALGQAAGAKQVLVTHYDRGYDDAFLQRQEALAPQDGLCRFAREGMVIEL